jgi:SpoVG
MQVMDVRIRPANEDFVKSYASICFEECFLVHDIGIIKGPTGVFIRLPSYPAIPFRNAEQDRASRAGGVRERRRRKRPGAKRTTSRLTPTTDER